MKLAVIATTKGAGSTFVSTNLAFVSNFTYIDANIPHFGSTLFECEKVNEEIEVFVNIKTVSQQTCDVG